MCGEVKPLDHFNWNGGGYGEARRKYRQNKCKPCDRSRARTRNAEKRKHDPMYGRSFSDKVKYYKDNPETKKKNNARRHTVNKKRVYRKGEADVHTSKQPVHPEQERVRAENRALLVDKENSQSGTREGFVYILSNPAWPGWVKVGRALDAEGRTNGYQTGTPFRDYVCHYVEYFPDRYAAEKRVHASLMWDSLRVNGEWFHVPVAKAINCVQSVQWEYQNVLRSSVRSPKG